MFLSVLVPVYNGARFLETCLSQLHDTLGERPYSSEIVVCEDGSTDGTKQLIERLKGQYDDIRFIQSDSRLGRGGALRRAAGEARGEIVLYLDVDMATHLTNLDDVVEAVSNGSDLVTGSRYHPESRVRRTVPRLMASKVYNGLVRAALSSRVKDHQCGFKAFKSHALEALLADVRSNHWFWDTEVLVRAQHRGYRVEELPVVWEENSEGTTVSFRRDIPYFLRETFRLRRELRKGG